MSNNPRPSGLDDRCRDQDGAISRKRRLWIWRVARWAASAGEALVVVLRRTPGLLPAAAVLFEGDPYELAAGSYACLLE